MRWNIEKEERVYDGHFKIDKLSVRHELFEGGYSKSLIRERVLRQNSVAVLPYDPHRDEVVLIEQFRIGSLEKKEDPWLYEIIAGLVEKGESLEDVVYREAIEEANCKLSEIKHISSFYPSAGGLTEVSSLFIGKTDTSNLGGVHGAKDEGEDIRVHVMPSDEALQMLNEGKICSASAMITLFYFKDLREKLMKDWR